MVYDPARRALVLFGGNVAPFTPTDDTWAYQPVHRADWTPIGAGCPGVAGTPALAPLDGALPWLGETFTLQVTNLGSDPASHLPFVFLGDSAMAWGAVALPIDLGYLGMPGCALHTSVLLSAPLVNEGGAATLPLPLPPPGLHEGLALYAQVAVTSPGANPLGMVMSNAGEMRFGAK
jgi:hypothetical protein